jgi:hypothetical protein
MDKTIDMAREAGFTDGELAFMGDNFRRFADLVRADERESFKKECEQYANWLDEAAADIEDWGMYASEYLQQKWDLPDQVQDYKNRAAAIRNRGNV